MSYSEYKIGVVMHGTLDPSDHEDQAQQLDDMLAIMKAMALVMEWMFGYSAIRPVPKPFLIDRQGFSDER